jgi:hypothetical protein
MEESRSKKGHERLQQRTLNHLLSQCQKVGIHAIPDDGDSEAGRKKPVESSEDVPKSIEASTAATAADATTKPSHCKARKLERELKTLDSSWNPTDKAAMAAPIVVETEVDGNEKAMEVHFVFDTELMTEQGDLKTFKEALAKFGQSLCVLQGIGRNYCYCCSDTCGFYLTRQK